MIYAAFGTDIASDLPLEPLPASQAKVPAVIFQHRVVPSLGDAPMSGCVSESQRRRVRATFQRNIVRIRVDDQLHFSFSSCRRTISCLYTRDVAPEQLRYWFLQKILPAYLLLQGHVEILHASAVEIDGRVAAFTAPAGTGKSTLVNHFVAAGHALFADEHVVIPNGTSMALPTIPYLRPNRQLESLGEIAATFASGPLPMGCFYILSPVSPTAQVTIEKLSGAGAAVALCMRQQFKLHGFEGHDSVQRLERFSRISSRVQVKRLYVPRHLDRLPEVREAIRHDLAS